MRCVLGVATPVVEKVADIVCLEHFHESLIFLTVVVQALELVAAGAKGAGWCMFQCCDLFCCFLAGINQFFTKRTDDAVHASIDFADLIFVLAGSLDDSACTGVNDGGDPTGLSIEKIGFGHVKPVKNGMRGFALLYRALAGR